MLSFNIAPRRAVAPFLGLEAEAVGAVGEGQAGIAKVRIHLDTHERATKRPIIADKTPPAGLVVTRGPVEIEVNHDGMLSKAFDSTASPRGLKFHF